MKALEFCKDQKGAFSIIMKEDIIAGLDIGSTEARLVVGQRTAGEENKIQVIGATSVPSEGISKGVIKSIDDATSSVSALLEKAERLIGVPINSVWASINDPYIKCSRSKGVVAVGRSNGEITQEDMDRAIEAARALSVPTNYEIIHVIPVKFTVDNQEDVKDPIGMNGIRLEVEALIIQAMSSQVKNLTKSIYRTGLDIEDIILSPLAASEAVATGKQKELGTAIVSIGASTTGLSVYEEGHLMHTAVLPVGSEHITSDVAIGLRCPINLADRVKLEYGNADPGNFNSKDKVDISDLAKEEEVDDDISEISKKYVAEIIQARVEEIFEKVDEELKSIDRSGMLPAGVILVGGGSKLDGIVDVCKEKLRLPVSLGSSKNADILIDKVNDPKYLSSLGLVMWGDIMTSRKGGGSLFGGKGTVDKTISKIKDFLSNLTIK